MEPNQTSNRLNPDEPWTDENGVLNVPSVALKKNLPNPTVILADGTKLKGTASQVERIYLWVMIEKDEEHTMMMLFPIFNDKTKTETIQYTYFDTDKPEVYNGFTEMNVIQEDYDGKISIRLTKPI